MIRKLFYLFIFTFFFSGNPYLFGQQGKVDNTFNTFDDGTKGDGFNEPVRTLLLQSDGNLIVGGDYLSLNGFPVSYLTRLNPDGTIDESFNTGTGFNGKIYASFLQDDGKIILGGSFTSYNGISAGRIIRLNSDGSYDFTFNTTIGATTGIVYDIASQSDGKIIIVGSFTKYTNTTVNRVARLLPNGSLDSSFLTGSGSALNVSHVRVLPSGQITLTGNFITFNGIPANRIIRLNINGTLDTDFSTGSGFDGNVNAAALQPDGKIILGGSFSTYNGVAANRIIRLNEDGTIDESFQKDLGFNKDGVQVIKVNMNGEIMVGTSFAGLYNNTEFNRLIFLKEDGTLQPNFDIGAGPASASVLSLEFDEEGNWFVGGSFSVFNGHNQGKLAKINNEGEHDSAYLSSGIGFDNSVFSILPLLSKKIIVGGNFKKFNEVPVSKITCLLEDGSIDHSFNTQNSGANNVIKTAVLQTDGKVILGGNFTKYNDVLSNRLVRIFENGQIDTSFILGEGFNGQINSLAIQPDQKIIAGGSFTKFNGSVLNAGRIVRLLPDGSKDPSFDTGLGADGIIEMITLQPDGKILAGGRFKTFNNLPFAGLVRLNTDGSIDSSFNIRQGFDKYVYAIALQADQKIIIGGSFLTFNGISQKRILRLNTDGSLDASFESGTGFSKGDVRTILVQPDQRILVGGAFSGTYKNITSQRLIRLLASGDYDNSFTAPLNNTLFAMRFAEDYKLLIGGNFNSVSGISKHRIARLKLCVDNTIWNGNSWSNGFPSPGKDVYFKEDYPNLTSATICGCSIDQGKTVVLLEKNTLGIEFAYTGSGTLVLEDSASLYQSDDDMINTGIIHMKRKTNPVMRYDLTYWSSPVDNQKLYDLSPETLYDKFFWYDPISKWSVNYFGTMMMVPGQGYNIRAPQSYSLTERSIFEGIFKGIPNNGKIEFNFEYANRYYLVGNPYPSAISADAFLKYNDGKTKGALYFWTHNAPPANNHYSGDGFATYNFLGGVGTKPAIVSGVSNSAPDGTIASGQGFLIKSNIEGTIEFNNSMRVMAKNTAFFKPAKNSTADVQIEKHRFWLNLKNDDNGFRQILLGYADGASNALDLSYDAELLTSEGALDFYSILENKKLVIQGKALPFVESDSIVLGYKANVKTTLTFEIDHQDKFFDFYTIFLVDKTANKIHDLSKSTYQFNSEIGTYNDRFLITYTNKILSIDENERYQERLLVSVRDQIISIDSVDDNLKEVFIYDSSGNQLYKKDKIVARKISIENLFSSHQVLFVKINLENGKTTSQKVIF